MNYACILLPYPPSLNGNLSAVNGRAIKSARYRAWEIEAGHALNHQRPKPVAPPYAVSIAAARPDKRKRDIDNIIKPCLDILTAHGLITDDSAVNHLTAYWDTPENIVNGIRVEVKSA